MYPKTPKRAGLVQFFVDIRNCLENLPLHREYSGVWGKFWDLNKPILWAKVTVHIPLGEPTCSRLRVEYNSTIPGDGFVGRCIALGEPTCSRLRVEYNSTIPGDGFVGRCIALGEPTCSRLWVEYNSTIPGDGFVGRCIAGRVGPFTIAPNPHHQPSP